MKGPNHLAKAFGDATPADIAKAVERLCLSPHQLKWLEHDTLWNTYTRLSARYDKASAAHTLHVFGPGPLTQHSLIVCPAYPCTTCRNLEKSSRAAHDAMDNAWDRYSVRDAVWNPEESPDAPV